MQNPGRNTTANFMVSHRMHTYLCRRNFLVGVNVRHDLYKGSFYAFAKKGIDPCPPGRSVPNSLTDQRLSFLSKVMYLGE